jgi:hypothetical protein
MKTDVMFASIRHPQANPFERCTRESGNFCHETHKNGQNPYLTLQGWLNGTLSDLTGYSPVELIFDSLRLNSLKSSLRKGLKKNHRPKACRKGF